MLDDAMSKLDLVVRRAMISSTCAPGWTDNVRCTSTGNGGWSFAGTQTATRPAAFISMITAICDEDDQDQSQTSVDLRNSALPDHALIEATGMPESEIAALCDGRLAVSASLALILGAFRQQRGFLAQRPAAKGPLGGDALACRFRPFGSRDAADCRGLKNSLYAAKADLRRSHPPPSSTTPHRTPSPARAPSGYSSAARSPRSRRGHRAG